MQRCTVCALDPATLGEIESALATMPSREVAQSFGISKSALLRHHKNHPAAEMVALTPTRPKKSDDPAIGQVEQLVASCWDSLQAAKATGNLSQIAVHHREYRAALDDLHERQLAADLLELKRKPAAAVNIQASAEWVENRDRVLTIAEAHDGRCGHTGADSVRVQLAEALGASEKPLDVDLARSLDPAQLAHLVGRKPGDTADAWQLDVLSSTAQQLLLLCHRQSGKSSTAAVLAVHEAIYRPGSTTLLISSQRQSKELFRKVLAAYGKLGRPVAAKVESTLSLELANGSRVVSLPKSESIRGFTADLLIVDEAAHVEDAVMAIVRPMLTLGGRLVALGTPAGQLGWFWEAWTSGGDAWDRATIRADENPRISAEKLAAEKEALPDRAFREEYLCEFMPAQARAFSPADISRALDYDLEPIHFKEA